MGRFDDQRMYLSFEEFERDELRRMDAIGASVGDLLDDVFAEELDFDGGSVRNARHDDEDDEE